MKLTSALKDFQYGISLCYKCGVCTYGAEADLVPVCPMYAYDKSSTFSPSGLCFVSRALLEGHLEYGPSVAEIAFSCTGCGACGVICNAVPFPEPHATPTDVIRALRHELVKRDIIPKGFMDVFRDAVKKDGDILDKGGSADLKFPESVKADKADTVLFGECFHSPSQAAIYESAGRLLERMGKQVSVFSDGGCCGSSLYDFGFWRDLQKLVESKWEKMKKSEDKEFLFINPHCQEFIVKQYPEILPDFSGIKTRHFSELLLQSLKEGKLKSKKNGKATVTYLDPCSLGRGLGIYEAPREVLRSLDGVELKEMKGNRSNSFCCGSRAVGNYHPDFSKETAKTGIKNFKQTGAEILITACPYCKQAFQGALPSEEKARVKDLIEFVDERTK